MTKYADLSLDQIRDAYKTMIYNAKLAFAANNFGLSRALDAKAKGLWAEFVMRIQNDDPWTTEADIRYFEGINI
jgi:hypothetical protein